MHHVPSIRTRLPEQRYTVPHDPDRVGHRAQVPRPASANQHRVRRDGGVRRVMLRRKKQKATTQKKKKKIEEKGIHFRERFREKNIQVPAHRGVQVGPHPYLEGMVWTRFCYSSSFLFVLCVFVFFFALIGAW